MPNFDPLASPVAVTFQAIGTLLLALMIARLGRIFGWRYANRWAIGFGALLLALASQRAFIAGGGTFWWLPYLAGEWAFLALLAAGCRELGGVAAPNRRSVLYALPAALVVAALVARLSPTFNDLFVVQALLMSLGFAAAFVTLGRFSPERRTAGWQMMRLALALLGTLFLSYVPLYWASRHIAALSFLSFSALADLLGEVLLGFGMVLVISEEASRELNDAVVALKEVRNQLEEKLRIDPLTEVLNRHAFYSMLRVQDEQTASGTVVMIDIDHLKEINDQAGHVVGDAAIRAAANAVREKVRADDLLFRWGGDEFLLVVPNLRLEIVSRRLQSLADGITFAATSRHPAGHVRLSWGGAEFGPKQTIDQAIALADAAMYQRRLLARRLNIVAGERS
jgi:diguanylate cyclase (GGDEF)-like protein